MASYTVEKLYYGEKYNIMGNAAAEIMTAGIPGDSEELRTQTELCLVKHTLLAFSYTHLDVYKRQMLTALL